jgi:phenylpropionate dioxygenase-like ring-hydroxylating dioxygenase large terminal subunit
MSSRVHTDRAQLLTHVASGRLPAFVYNDDEVFTWEKERLFARAWMFLAHESEIPSPGDYVVRRIVDDSFIVARDGNGQIGVHLNVCLHRGMQVCRAEQGNATMFRCPYHAWTYRNDGRLIVIPFHDEAYGGDEGFVKEGRTLVPAPRVATRNGLIFASLDPDAPSLDDYIGDFGFYLDLYTRQSEAGVELRGPQRWRVHTNWKIGAENFIGDSYHTPHTHQSVVEIGLFREPTASKRKEGALYRAGAGGGTTYKLPPGTLEERLRYVGYPDEMVHRMVATWSPDQLAMVRDDAFMVSAATIFPNLSFVHNWPKVGDDSTITPFISLRLFQPVSAGETEILSWFAVDALAPEDFKERSYQAYLMCFGTSGMFEQDDVENWVSITAGARGTLARRLLLDNRMGLRTDGSTLAPVLDTFHGPGTAHVGYGEYNQRHWWDQWSACIAQDPP